ncbi:MAG: family 78 glycoside hydrolase catalytic domain [bacterium]
MFNHAKWIWLDGENQKNIYFRFRRTFTVTAKPHCEGKLHITASARYVLYLNGELLGQGPPRAWPEHFQYDTYDISSQLKDGENVLAVLVHYFGIGNMQWIPTAPGLIAQLDLHHSSKTDYIGTDETWRVSREDAFLRRTPRISIQMGFEEQYDARLTEERWPQLDFDDRSWQNSLVVADVKKGPVKNLEPRTIPFLTAGPQYPQRILKVEAVRPVQHVWSLDLRPYFNPEDNSANFMTTYGYLFTQIYAANTTTAFLTRLHSKKSRVKLNGSEVPSKVIDENYYFHFFRHELHLQAGWNMLLIDFCQGEHLTRFVATLDAEEPLKLTWNGSGGGTWVLLGPFPGPLAEDQDSSQFPSRTVATTTLQPEATGAIAEEIWRTGRPETQLQSSKLAVEIQQKDIAVDDIFARAFADKHVADQKVTTQNSEHLLQPDGDWTTISPADDDADVRLLLDFGRETVGHFCWEIDAAEGTIIDFVGFENQRLDGALDWTEGANNSLRYICKEGRQSYQSFWRRGLRYAYVILRKLPAPVRLRRIAMIENIYPQQNRDYFTCSDDKLNKIWQVGAHTMACCSEDTYVDCPAYEQVHWVGDARNEALVDWIVNGDARLWKHCLLQAAYSLERSPLVESHVPSSWPIILPAWSFLWLRSCREYYLFTGDRTGVEKLWPWILRNVDGVQRFLNPDGLFEIRAWNMFDWADMDTPNDGVVTHQNCLLVLALHEISELAKWLEKKPEAAACKQLADGLAEAINKHLYDLERAAYADARHPDGKLSKTLSQQTQTVAFVSGVAKEERADKARKDMLEPPDGYVLAGSPFFMFFLLEALMREGNTAAVLHEIRDKWGFMIDQGATTFWEMWSGKSGRLTRSHCHGWSAAPTFFLSTYILGVEPLEPGFSRTRIAPQPGDLRRARGSVPTPHGDIFVSWENPEDGDFSLHVRSPEVIVTDVVPPTKNAKVTVDAQK